MKLKEIIKKQSELDPKYGVSNNILEYVDAEIIGHYGNTVCMYLRCSNIVPVATYNNISNLGFLVKAIVELFDLTQEDGLMLSKIKNIPCRLVFEDKSGFSRCVGFGHYMEDQFVLTEDFVKIDSHAGLR